MKKYNFLYLRSFLAITLLFVVSFFTSCSDDDSGVSTTTTITSVNRALNTPTDGSPVEIDVPVEMGYPNTTYFIHGTGFSTLKKIYFNGLESYFNPTMVTDNVIVVTIDEDTPYENASSELKIVTSFGTVVYHFVIAPPAPVLTKGFSPVNAADGSIMTIYGNFFLDPIVTFGTIPATVISNSLTEIKVTVPVGADKQYVTVKTISGSVTSSYAVGTAIYDDVAYYGLDFPSWNNHTYESDGNADQGLIYIKKNMGAWDSLQGNWGWYDQIAPYKGIRLSVKASVAGTVKLIFNGDWSERNMMSVQPGWNTFVFTWAELGDADHVQNISFQNMSKSGADGIANTISIDNIGFVLK
ncbi:IPT/TIG domain-containing protein [Flavobacterium sp. IMCC34518]|uniref:IPT/TIG domain-containing protein n=1 Tax=Flavobacterium sp. IMCC34518 TaxID=3003623 RepID=UPI0024824B24|nr:IPT/TIG domain-containing protein [Flavobacterium sp. IMCC34518]